MSDLTRREKIEEFMAQAGYWIRVQHLGDLRHYCATQYDLVSDLCARNHDYLKRLLGLETRGNRPSARLIPSAASKPVEARGVAVHSPENEVLPMTFDPSPVAAFKPLLLAARSAWVSVHYADGTCEIKPWSAGNISETSNILGNLRSRPEFRQGEWQRRGIERIHVSIDKPHQELTP